MTLRDRLPEIGVAAVGLYAAGRLTGVIGGGGETADPVSQGGPSGGDRNTTGSDSRPQITPRAPGLEQLLERQRDRQRSTVPTTGGTTGTTGGGTVEETTAASDTTDTDPTGGGGTTGTTDTTAGGDDRNAVGTPGDLGGDGSTVADLFSGGLSSSPTPEDRNVTGDPGSTSATDDRTGVAEQTQRPDMNTAPDPSTTSQTQRPDEPQDTASGGGQLGGFDPADPTDDDDDRGGGGSDSTSASEDDSGGSSVADAFSGGVSSGIAGDN
jgi:hypothetical protein